MKFYLPVCSMLLLFCGSCLDGSEEESLDLRAPTISAAGPSPTIAPTPFISVAEGADRIPVSFEVNDEVGLSEIRIETHNAFDGHVHGRSGFNGDFVLLRHQRSIRAEAMTDPLVFRSEEGGDLDIYLDERNPFIEPGNLVLAGPYHFSIKAVDDSGNETSYDDNSTYHSTFFLQRPYAPRVEVSGIDRSSGSVAGKVWRDLEQPASGNIVFLWAYIVTPNPNNAAQEGEVQQEWIWGESSWPHQFRPGSGKPLPSGELIDLSSILSDKQAIKQMQPTDRLRLWVEDENGNISVHTYPN